MTIAIRATFERRAAEHHDVGHHAAWYVLAGLVTTATQALLFLAFHAAIGAQAANLVAIALTTVGNTEFHRRVTFAGRTSRPTQRHFQDFLTFAFYAGYGSIVLLSLDTFVAEPTPLLQTAALLAASGVGGVIRFVALRWWVFSDR